MKCPNCNEDIKEGSTFCKKCGMKFSDYIKCDKCLTYNKKMAKFCVKCGDKLFHPKKKHYFLKGLLVIIVVVLLYNGGKYLYNEYQEKRIKKLKDLPSSMKIETSFANGEIKADEYIMQLSYSMFDNKMLDSKYKSNVKEVIAPHVFDQFVEHFDELSLETREYIYKNYFLTHLRFDTDASDNKKAVGLPFVDSVYAEDDVSTLDKVYLSSNKNFVIWYTETGEDAITLNDAVKIADELEKTVASLESKYGLKYKYEHSPGIATGNNSTEPMMRVLLANDIEAKYIYEAMPVYIAKSSNGGSDALAFYFNKPELPIRITLDIAGFFMKFGELSYSPVIPYIVIFPNNIGKKESLKLVTAHELVHHYQPYICGDGKYKQCMSGHFTTETIANLYAANVVETKSTKTVLNNHVIGYINDINMPLDLIWDGEGYPNFTFAQIYSNVVLNGNAKLLESMKIEAPNTLKYLYDNSDNKFDFIMQDLASKSVTNDYEKSVFKSEVMPETKRELCTDFCNYEDTIKRTSINYLSFIPKKYKTNAKITFEEVDNFNKLSYVILGNKNGKYVEVTRGSLDVLTINTDDYKDYSDVMIGIVNGSITDSINYKTSIIKEAVLEFITQTDKLAADFDYSSVFVDKNGCVEIQYKNMIDSLQKIVRYGVTVVKALNDYQDDTVEGQNTKDYLNAHVPELNYFDSQLELAKKIDIKTMRVCSVNIGNDKSVDELHKEAMSLLGGIKFKAYDFTDEYGYRTSVGVSFNVFNKKIKLYALSTSDVNNLYMVDIEQ